MNHKDDCRTAPATPGLLKIMAVYKCGLLETVCTVQHVSQLFPQIGRLKPLVGELAYCHPTLQASARPSKLAACSAVMLGLFCITSIAVNALAFLTLSVNLMVFEWHFVFKPTTAQLILTIQLHQRINSSRAELPLFLAIHMFFCLI